MNVLKSSNYSFVTKESFVNFFHFLSTNLKLFREFKFFYLMNHNINVNESKFLLQIIMKKKCTEKEK